MNALFFLIFGYWIIGFIGLVIMVMAEEDTLTLKDLFKITVVAWLWPLVIALLIFEHSADVVIWSKDKDLTKLFTDKDLDEDDYSDW